MNNDIVPFRLEEKERDAGEWAYLPDSVPLTLEAYPDGGGKTVAALHIRLVKPATLPEKVMRMVAAEPGQRWVVSSGESLPVYGGCGRAGRGIGGHAGNQHGA